MLKLGNQLFLNTNIFAIIFCILIHASSFAVEKSDNFLNEDEIAWLSAHKIIRVGVGSNFPPYQWVEDSNDNPVFRGIVSEYLTILENKLKVKMEIAYGLKFSQALEKGKSKDIDFFPCLASTPDRSKFLLFTEPYISYPSVILTRIDAPFIGGINDLHGRKVSLVKGQIIHAIVKERFAHLNIQILESENSAEDLQAVSFGRADACLMDLGVASYLIQKLRITNLKVAAPTGLEKIELAMGVRDDWPIFRNILQKTLSTISPEERDIINQRWIQLKYDPGISRAKLLRWSSFIGAGALFCFTLFYLWTRSLQREISARKQIEEERNILITQLKKSLNDVKTLRGFLPICSHCRKVRQDSGYWQQIETYIQEHTDAQFSHGICPDCMRKLYPDLADHIIDKVGRKSPATPEVPSANCDHRRI